MILYFDIRQNFPYLFKGAEKFKFKKKKIATKKIALGALFDIVDKTRKKSFLSKITSGTGLNQ